MGEDLRLGEIQGQERAAAPRNNEGGKFDDGEGEEFPWDPNVQQHTLEGVRVRLIKAELRFAWFPFPKIMVSALGRRIGQVLRHIVCDEIAAAAVFVDFKFLCRSSSGRKSSLIKLVLV